MTPSLAMPGVIGIGTDVLSVERMRSCIDSPSFVQKTFTEAEVESSASRADPAGYYAKVFAGKEAVFKCFGVSADALRTWRDIEVVDGGQGQPVAKLHGELKVIALLSFSTKGSAHHESVTRVVEALQIVRERDPKLLVDGELQLDAAIVPSVAARKVPGESPVARRANVLVFPDLNSGNVACKCVQRFAKADAFGPFLQGFSKTVSDLSRGSTLDDVVGGSVMACVHAQGLKRLCAGGCDR